MGGPRRCQRESGVNGSCSRACRACRASRACRVQCKKKEASKAPLADFSEQFAKWYKDRGVFKCANFPRRLSAVCDDWVSLLQHSMPPQEIDEAPALGRQHWHRSAAASSCSLKLLSLEAMCYWYEPCNPFSPSAGWKGPSSLLRDRRGRCCGGQECPTSGCSSIPHPEGKDARSGDIEGEQRRFRPSGGPECRRQLGIPHSERRPDARYQSKGWPCKAKGGEGFSWSRRRSWRCFECTPQRLALALCEQSGVSGVDAELLGQLESERKCRAETARVCYS